MSGLLRHNITRPAAACGVLIFNEKRGLKIYMKNYVLSISEKQAETMDRK